MKDIQAKEKYVLTFPEDENGDPVTNFRFMLSLGRPISEVEAKLQKALGTLPGIDQIKLLQIGRYTLEVVIARTFDADEVLTELKRRLETDVLSEIIQPNKKIIV